jgi:hypothetical protein
MLIFTLSHDLTLQQMTHRVDRAIDGVKIKFRKPKSRVM